MSNEYQNIVNFVGRYRDPDVLHLLPPSSLKFGADTRNGMLEEWANQRETMSLTRAESGGEMWEQEMTVHLNISGTPWGGPNSIIAAQTYSPRNVLNLSRRNRRCCTMDRPFVQKTEKIVIFFVMRCEQ